jgi:hypothetical protein
MGKDYCCATWQSGILLTALPPSPSHHHHHHRWHQLHEESLAGEAQPQHHYLVLPVTLPSSSAASAGPLRPLPQVLCMRAPHVHSHCCHCVAAMVCCSFPLQFRALW